MKLLTKKIKLNELYKNAKIPYICKEKFRDRYIKDKKNYMIWDPCHYTGKCRGATHSRCNLKHSEAKKILQFFIIVSNYDNNFTMK